MVSHFKRKRSVLSNQRPLLYNAAMNQTNHMLQKNVPLKHLNTFGIEATTHYFARIETPQQIQSVLSDPQCQPLPKLILGEGSNVLFTKDFEGLVIKNALSGISTINEDQNHIWLKIGAGENWHSFVLYCVSHEYAGVENLSLIPGTMGAAPMQNIGAYGAEIKDVFVELNAIRISDGKLFAFKKEACQFAYRNSIFKQCHKNKYIITDVILRLNKKPNFNISYNKVKDTLKAMNIDQLSIKAISDAVIYIRRTKLPDPKKIGNAGSFFKNPEISHAQLTQLVEKHPDTPYFSTTNERVKIPAAWLIDQCGWKGRRFGNIGVHDLQPLVLVNYGGGSGLAIKQLADDIQADVFNRFGIGLEPEVNIIL